MNFEFVDGRWQMSQESSPKLRALAEYADLDLGLVDASVIALAEEIGVYRLATRDVRHFSAVRLRCGRPFELVVHPRRPENDSTQRWRPTDTGGRGPSRVALRS
jgi:hypothetical protein